MINTCDVEDTVNNNRFQTGDSRVVNARIIWKKSGNATTRAVLNIRQSRLQVNVPLIFRDPPNRGFLIYFYTFSNFLSENLENSQ